MERWEFDSAASWKNTFKLFGAISVHGLRWNTLSPKLKIRLEGGMKQIQ